MKNNKVIILRVLILVILGWFTIGFFPILNIEGDSSFFSAGCERLWRNGIKIPPDYFYEWNMQPMSGILVVSIKSVLPQFSCEQIYCVLTICSSLIYLFVSSVFISKLTRIRWEYCFCILMLFPESYSIAYYPNTTIFASLIALVGLILILKKPLNFFSIFLLGIAPLFRVDILAIYPVVFTLLWMQIGFRKALLKTTIYALCIILVSSTGFLLLKANPFETLISYQNLTNTHSSFDIASFFKINATYYTITASILLIYGTIILIRQKNYKLLLLSFLPIAIFYFIYKDFSGAAPKHIQYLIPFAASICVISLKEIKIQIVESKYLFVSLIAIIFLTQNIIGIRIYPNVKPWLSKNYSSLYSRPTFKSIVSFKYGNLGIIEIAVGSGQIIPTSDEFMLLSGNFFAPFYWHDIKNKDLQERRVLKQIIESGGDTLNFMTTQASDWPLTQQLYNLGFEITKIENRNLLSSSIQYMEFKNVRKLICVNRIYVDRNPDSFNAAFSAILYKPLYVMVNWDWQQYLINEKKTKALLISDQLSVVP